MPDITMCANGDCVVRELCFRYRAIPDDYQSIAVFEPESNGLCKYFWNITKEKVRPVKEADAWCSFMNSNKGETS